MLTLNRTKFHKYEIATPTETREFIFLPENFREGAVIKALRSAGFIASYERACDFDIMYGGGGLLVTERRLGHQIHLKLVTE